MAIPCFSGVLPAPASVPMAVRTAAKSVVSGERTSATVGSVTLPEYRTSPTWWIPRAAASESSSSLAACCAQYRRVWPADRLATMLPDVSMVSMTSKLSTGSSPHSPRQADEVTTPVLPLFTPTTRANV